MPDLLILGVHPHAVEMAEIVDRINQAQTTWNLLGFVSPYEVKAGEQLLGLPVFGFEQAMEQYPSALVVPEYDWPHKSHIPRDRLASLIDPSVFVSRTAEIGPGCVIYPNCYIGAHARIGSLLFCLSGSVINHNDVLGDRVTLTSGVVVAGDVHLESDCYLGQRSTVRELRTIGRGSLIGMGCVVLNDVPPNSVMVGNPARRLRARELNYPGKRFVKAARRVAGKGTRAMRRKWLGISAKSLLVPHTSAH